MIGVLVDGEGDLVGGCCVGGRQRQRCRRGSG